MVVVERRSNFRKHSALVMRGSENLSERLAGRIFVWTSRSCLLYASEDTPSISLITASSYSEPDMIADHHVVEWSESDRRPLPHTGFRFSTQ